MALQIETRVEHWPLRAPFRDNSGTVTALDVVVVLLRADGTEGRGEAAGVYYRGETPESIVSQIENVRAQIERGVTRDELQRLLPAGGARNAVDCALWELESRCERIPVWSLAKVSPPRPLRTTYTLGAAAADVMARHARANSDARALKLKLTGETLDADRVRAVREARPDVWLGVDANQAFTRAFLDTLMPTLVQADVRMIEQPFAVGHEAELTGFDMPIPVAADESIQSLPDLHALARYFQMVNIKLDKCGGLTEALSMARTAHELGLQVMVGNMIGTSLAMAPAFIVGQLCEVVDLDGPLLLARDREAAAAYRNGDIFCDETLWGHANTRELR